MRRFLIRSLFVVGIGGLCLYGRAWFLSWQVHNFLTKQEVNFTHESLRLYPSGVTTLRFKEIRIAPATLYNVKISQPFWAWHSAQIMIEKLEITTPYTTVTAQEVEGKYQWQSNQLILHYHSPIGNFRTLKDVIIPFQSEGVIHLLPHHTIVFEQVKLTSNDINLRAEGQLDWHTKDGLLSLTIDEYERALALLANLNLISQAQAKWGRFGNKIANFFSKHKEEPQTTINLTFSQGMVKWGPLTLGHF